MGASGDPASSPGTSTADSTTVFDQHRDLLFGVAYRVLGRAMDAEDVVQDAWLRWRDVDHAEVVDARAFLVRVVTRLAIDRLRSAQHRRETYVGPWLPEPILTSPDVADDVVQAESVSLAMLVVLETLSPLERAVFVLREAFSFSYAEIGEILDRNEDAVRQLARRARQHVQERRHRFDTDRATQQRVSQLFLAACMTGDLSALMAMLAPEVTLHADGGGLVRAPRRVIVGPDKVGRFLAAATKNGPQEPRIYLADINGQPAFVITSQDEIVTVLAVDIAGDKVTRVHLIANPEKLRALADATTVGVEIDLPPAP
jgi:RNA polymerase sigma-70 factor (ECF subfamily)